MSQLRPIKPLAIKPRTAWIAIKEITSIKEVPLTKQNVHKVYLNYIGSFHNNHTFKELPAIIDFFRILSSKYINDTDELSHEDKQLLIDIINENRNSVSRMVNQKENIIIDQFVDSMGMNDLVKPATKYFESLYI